MRNRQIREGKPQCGEQQHSGELHPFGKSTHNQCNGDSGEGSLKNHEGKFRNHHALAEGCRISNTAGDRIKDALQKQPVKSADKCIALRERQRVAVNGPQHNNQRENSEHLHQDG